MTSQKKETKIKRSLPFIIGAVMGLLGQTLIPTAFRATEDTIWYMRGLVSDMDIYPLVIVFMICHKAESPRAIFTRIFLFFVGLCVGYYLWTTFLGLCSAIETGYKENFFSVFYADLLDGAVYSVLGFFAALWGYAMGKLKCKGRMAAYYVMTVPFIIVEVIWVVFSMSCVVPQVMMALIDLLCLAGIIVFMVRERKEFSHGDTAVFLQQEN